MAHSKIHTICQTNKSVKNRLTVFTKEVSVSRQPDIPYAMGGCICEDTVCDSNDINHFVNDTSGEAVSDNLISIGIFTIPKNIENESNFDMFSLIIESSEWDKQKIHASIAQVSLYSFHFMSLIKFCNSLFTPDAKKGKQRIVLWAQSAD